VFGFGRTGGVLLSLGTLALRLVAPHFGFPGHRRADLIAPVDCIGILVQFSSSSRLALSWCTCSSASRP